MARNSSQFLSVENIKLGFWGIWWIRLFKEFSIWILDGILWKGCEGTKRFYFKNWWSLQREMEFAELQLFFICSALIGVHRVFVWTLKFVLLGTCNFKSFCCLNRTSNQNALGRSNSIENKIYIKEYFICFKIRYKSINVHSKIKS